MSEGSASQIPLQILCLCVFLISCAVGFRRQTRAALGAVRSAARENFTHTSSSASESFANSTAVAQAWQLGEWYVDEHGTLMTPDMQHELGFLADAGDPLSGWWALTTESSHTSQKGVTLGNDGNVRAQHYCRGFGGEAASCHQKDTWHFKQGGGSFGIMTWNHDGHRGILHPCLGGHSRMDCPEPVSGRSDLCFCPCPVSICDVGQPVSDPEPVPEEHHNWYAGGDCLSASAAHAAANPMWDLTHGAHKSGEALWARLQRPGETTSLAEVSASSSAWAEDMAEAALRLREAVVLLLLDKNRVAPPAPSPTATPDETEAVTEIEDPAHGIVIETFRRNNFARVYHTQRKQFNLADWLSTDGKAVGSDMGMSNSEFGQGKLLTKQKLTRFFQQLRSAGYGHEEDSLFHSVLKDCK